MPRVTGLGGVFLKADDPKGLASWYAAHLRLPQDAGGYVNFRWREPDNPARAGMTVWSTFARDSAYFGPGDQDVMINYRVEDLDGLLELLRAEGVPIDPTREDTPYGRFAWITDPEGNRVELWEPPTGA
jgi:catechol 2,3-dioxygenase-like lactoylglutathione lyase family enzyme